MDERFHREGLADSLEAYEYLRFLGYEPFIHNRNRIRTKRVGAKIKANAQKWFRLTERLDHAGMVRVIEIYNEIGIDNLGYSTAHKSIPTEAVEGPSELTLF